MISENIINWLLEKENPSLRYRTLVDLLDKPLNDVKVKDSKKLIYEYQPVKDIFRKMNPDGYWLQMNPRIKVVFGKGVEYGAFATTHYCLSYLAELGLDKSHPLISKASERYLNLQKDDGDFWNHFSCLIGLNIRTFIMLGYKEDIRIKKSINLLLNTIRKDGGYLCDMHEGKYKKREVKSCIRGSVKALLAFSYLPEIWKHERCKKLINYFLNRNGIYRNNDPNEFVNKDMIRASFPITWRSNLFEILYSLSKMGYGNDERLKSAWDVIERMKNSDGRYLLHWTPSQSPWKVGKRDEPNKWITFYVNLAKKYKE